MKTFKNQRLNPNFQENLKTEIASSEKEIRQPKDNISPKSKTLYANYIPEKYLNEESVEETEEERVTELKLNDKSNNINNENGIKKLITINSMIHHIDYISTYKIVKAPEKSLKEKICDLEKQLFELMNMEYGKEIIYEDFVLVNDNQNYYVHMLRTAQLDPKKENFLLIHGFLSSSTHFLSILPYLLLKYNVFIPDTIGMGLSSRPQISFDSPRTFSWRIYGKSLYNQISNWH